MSKMVCDICGTTYEEASGACPVCGWTPGASLEPTDDMDDILNEDFQLDDLDDTDTAPQRAKAVFDYDAVNPHRRPAPQAPTSPRPAKPAPAPSRPQPEEEDEEEEESGSNKFLVVILVLLILALLAVSGYIAYTKLWKPNQVGSDTNKPQDVVVAEPMETTAPPFTQPVETEDTQPTEQTEATIPCTGLSLVAGMDKLTFAGQYWRLMVRYTPENTTDKVTYTSGDESVVTVDENGRVTAIGEGETVIVIQCGDSRVETPAIVSFATDSTEPASTPAAGTSGTGTAAGSTVATPSGGVLKLNKTDITFGKPRVYITLELENGISAESVKWSTSDSSVATVFNGNVTAIGKGVCVIRAEYNGQVAECVVRCNF